MPGHWRAAADVTVLVLVCDQAPAAMASMWEMPLGLGLGCGGFGLSAATLGAVALLPNSVGFLRWVQVTSGLFARFRRGSLAAGWRLCSKRVLRGPLHVGLCT